MKRANCTQKRPEPAGLGVIAAHFCSDAVMNTSCTVVTTLHQLQSKGRTFIYNELNRKDFVLNGLYSPLGLREQTRQTKENPSLHNTHAGKQTDSRPENNCVTTQHSLTVCALNYEKNPVQ